MESIGLPRLVKTGDAELQAASLTFSPSRSSRRALIGNEDTAKQPLPSRGTKTAANAGGNVRSPSPRERAGEAPPATTSGVGITRPTFTRRQSSVSANTTVEVPLGNGEVQSVVARRLSTNPALLSASGHRRSLSWFASAPHANTIEEDLHEEILEEKQERALTRDASPLEQFNAELMAYLEENSKLQPRRDAHGTAQLEDQEMTDRRRREAQLHRIEQRRATDKRKFELVDDMYDRALQRRYRAMQKIAADPPADRLIGHNMLQYLPASMVPGQRRDPVAAHTHAPETKSGGPGSGTHAVEGTLGGRAALDAANPIVFLTELDGNGTNGADPRPHAGTAQASQGTASQSAIPRLTGQSPQADAPALLPGQVPDDVRQQWRELGYDVTYVDTKGRAMNMPGMSSSRPAPHTSLGSGSAASTAVGAYDEGKWMKLAPMSGVCLVQKRLSPNMFQKATPPPTAETDTVLSRVGKGGSSRTHGANTVASGTSHWSFGQQK